MQKHYGVNPEEEHESARLYLKFLGVTLRKINWTQLMKGLIYQAKHPNLFLNIWFKIFMD